MFARIALTFVLLTIAIPNIGMSGVMMRQFESTVTVAASTGETPLRKEQDLFAGSTSLKGIVSNSMAMTNTSLQAICGPTLVLRPNQPLVSLLGVEECRFVPIPPIFKIPKIPIF